MGFLSADDLCRLAAERGLGFSILSDDIQRLWQIGVLRADLVISDKPIEIEGLVYLERNAEGNYLYADDRKCIKNSDGLLGIINQMEELPAASLTDLSPAAILRPLPCRASAGNEYQSDSHVAFNEDL